MGVKLTAIFLFILIFCSCGGNSSRHGASTCEVSRAIIADTVNPTGGQQDSLVSQRFLSLVAHIDSTGFVFDTLRYKPDGSAMHMIDGYAFFDVPKETTIPFFDQGAFGHQLESFSSAPFEKANRVTAYYFRQKTPTIDNEGQKWYTDGVIEEWVFDQQEQARAAMNVLMCADLTILYFNTGACACQIETSLYIFHSRASRFMRTQEDFFRWFVEQFDVQLYRNETYA